MSKSEPLFILPVTKDWIEQYVIVLYNTGNSYREIQHSLKSLFDVSVSIGWLSNLIHKTCKKPAVKSNNEDLSLIKNSANDELFFHNVPILSSICTNSLYCALLQKEQKRDAKTWESNLRNLKDHGYNPNGVILDGLNSLHAGHKLALGNINITYDVFHIIKNLKDLKRFVSNRLKSCRTNLINIKYKLENAKHKDRITQLTKQKNLAEKNYNEASYLYQQTDILVSWLHHDIFVIAGYEYSTRLNLLHFIIDEFQKIESLLPHKITPIIKTLHKNDSKLLGFVKELEVELEKYADELNCNSVWLWKIVYAQRLNSNNYKYHQITAKVKSRFNNNYNQIEQGVIDIMNTIEKASSLVENLNGRVKKFLRNHRHVDQETLDLFRFYINYTEFRRSRCQHRSGRSPAEILHNKKHPHFLELLGYKLFKRAS